MALCPACRTPGAYVGFIAVECPNHECVHFADMPEEVCRDCVQAENSQGQAANLTTPGSGASGLMNQTSPDMPQDQNLSGIQQDADPPYGIPAGDSP